MSKTSVNLFFEFNISVVSQFLGHYDLANLLLKRLYESDSYVDDYTPQIELQQPEATILEELRGELSQFRMLDVGVGLGRTTKHFAPLAKEYVGIDYSNHTIRVCRAKYPNLRFEVADARDLSLFNDNYFDFVLFSFNGIDSVEHDDRLAILREIKRITVKGGYFCFSTLNLNAWRLKPPFRFSRKPRILYRSTYNFLLNHEAWGSRNQIKLKPQHMMIYYTYKDFLLRNYFSTPSEQLRQLNEAGFVDSKAYDLNNGKVVKTPENMTDYYVYFLTRVR